MPRLCFTQNIQRHLHCPPAEVPGATVCEVLEGFFASHPGARGYLLDDQGALRPHMAVFVDGRQIEDRRALTDPVEAGGEVYVMQALSGG